MPPIRDKLRNLLDYDVLSAVTVRQMLEMTGLWLAYVLVTSYLGQALLHDPGVTVAPNWFNDLHGYLPTLQTVPPLARWDSVWYLSVATEGYPGMSGQSINNGTVLPLYGLAIRAIAKLFHLAPLWAGVWVSRCMLWLSMQLLFALARQRPSNADAPWAPVIAMLCFPSAYTLVAVYSEAIFLALCLASVLLASRRRFVLSALAVSLATLTRLHALALAPALALMGLAHWREQSWRPRALVAFAPPAAIGATVVGAGVYFKIVSGDPLLHLHRKAAFGLVDAGPMRAITGSIQQFREALELHTLGALTTLLEIPSALALIVASCVLLRRREWAYASFLLVSLSLNLRAGTLWGLPRYMIVMFPIFLLLGRLHRIPWAFHAYAISGVLWQALIMTNFVNNRPPAP